MKTVVLVCAVCYALLLLLPMPYLFDTAAPSPSQPGTTTAPPPNTPATPEPPTETITVLDDDAGVLYTFDVRDFLIYTVASEMPASYHEEALKAQAVAAYTYYLYEKEHNADNEKLQGADTSRVPGSFPTYYSPEGLQSLWGDNYEKNLQKIAAAVDSVFGKRVTYDGKTALAVYHSGNWGRTETAAVVWGNDYPYLQSVVSTGDLTAESCYSTVTVSETDLKAAFSDVTFSGTADSWVQSDPIRSEAGTVTAIRIGDKTFTGKEVRTALSLRSACFTVVYQAGEFTFTVRGHGHGVGMSQVGANAMAKDGFTYEEILHHYYPSATVI